MRNYATLYRSLLLGTLTLLSACSGAFKHSLSFNPAEPIRLAVLPFTQVDDTGALVQADATLAIDKIALVSSQLKQTPAEFVQSAVQSELFKASLDVVTPGVVEAALVHGGFTTINSKPVQIDLGKVFAADPKDICTKILSCDAVMYGKVTEWSRDYYGLQTISTVGIELKLVSAHTGKVLFESSAKDSDSRGISKGPTGFSNLVIEPIKGLDNSIITALASDVVEKAVLPLNFRKRPDFLTTPPPAILAAAHDTTTGTIAPERTLTVIVLGTPKQSGSFSIGTAIVGVPLVERSSGHYVGEYIPVSGDRFESQSVTVTLQDDVGRATQQTLGRIKVSYQ